MKKSYQHEGIYVPGMLGRFLTEDLSQEVFDETKHWLEIATNIKVEAKYDPAVADIIIPESLTGE